MEYIAKITKEQKIKDKKIWQYTFINIQTGEVSYFYNNYRIFYIPNLTGKLKLSSDNFYQSFNQNIGNEEEGILSQQENKLAETIAGLTRRPVKFETRQLIDILNRLHQAGDTWKKIANSFQRTERTIRNWRKEPNRPLQKVGRKPKINESIVRLLVSFLNTNNNNEATLKEMSDYLYKEIGQRFSIWVVFRILRKYDITWKKGTKKYSEQNIEKVKKFLSDNYWLLSHNFLLAMDECGFNLGEAPRYAWYRKDLRANVIRTGQRGFNYTLILCIQNINKRAIVSYKLIENERGGKKKGTDALDFYNFLKDMKLPTNETYYLLLDNSKIHYTTKKLRELGLSIEELARQKNIILKYLPPYSPELNPAEKCFNNIRHNIEKSRPRTYEELKLVIDKEVAKLQQQDLTKYFQSCFDYFKMTFGSGN